MPANETPLGFVSYPDKQTPQWYTDDGDTMGLESWLAQMELLGLPTYATFTDLPDASTTPSYGDAQQQFAAVAADRTVYRSDGTEWVPFMGQGTSDRPLQEQHVESLHAESAGIDLHTQQRREMRTQYETHRDYEQRGWQLDNVEDLTDWQVQNGTIEADTETVYSGDQSIKWEYSGGFDRLRLTNLDGIDFTRWIPTFALKLSEGHQGSRLFVRGNDTQGNEFEGYGRFNWWSGEVPAGGSDWRRMEIGWLNDVDGQGDPTNIVELDIRFHVEEHVWVDDIRMVPRPTQGYVILTFDNGFDTDYTEAYPYLDKYNMAGVSALHTDHIGDSGYLDESQIDEMAADGWEFISHNPHENNRASDTDDPDEWIGWLEESKEWLLERGFVKGAMSFVYPSWAVQEDTLDLTSRVHDVAYTGNHNGCVVPTTTSNPLNIMRWTDIQTDEYHDDGDISMDDWKNRIDNVAEYGGVTVLTFHEIEEGGRTEPDEFREMIDHIASKGGDLLPIKSHEFLDMMTASVRDVNLGEGVPTDLGWSRDGTVSLDDWGQPPTYNMSDTYNEIRIVFHYYQPDETGPTDEEPLYIRFNGNDDARYYWLDNQGTVTSDDDKALVADVNVSSGRGISGYMDINGSGGRVVARGNNLRVGGGYADSRYVDHLVHRDVEQVESIEIFPTHGTDTEVRGSYVVYGR